MNERGMSLPEVMICAFIFAILVTGLLRYYQLLHSGKQRQYADVSTVRHLHQMMRLRRIRDITADDADTFISWQKWESYQENVSPGCISVTIGLVSPGERRLTAGRWQCM